MSVVKQVSLEGFTKNSGRVNVPDVGRNEVPDLWTAGGECALPELGPCPITTTAALVVEERSCRRPDS